ncbi:MAG: 23S rRNA (adenine(2030)-N(6))-methyltransferase RlmJ [Opitutaceae bacterium]
MNYRHHYHAGNFADVMKHAVLVRIVRAMQRKERGFLYVDTHAGRGRYDLASAARGDTLERKPEWPEGIGRLWNRTRLPELLADYLAQVKAYDHKHGNLTAAPRFYPGSPRLVRALARPQDRLALFEKQHDEAGALRVEFARSSHVGIQSADGYAGLRGQLPAPEKRALVLIDPPFESQDEFSQITRAVADALKRAPAATIAVWYPLTERARVDAFFADLAALALPATFALELTVVGPTHPMKMKGCGLVVINPPYQVDKELTPCLTWMTEMLAQDHGGRAELRWLVKES